MKLKLSYVNFRLKAGLSLFLIIMLLSFIVPAFSRIDPIAWNSYKKDLPPSLTHLLGTTHLGQDTFSLLLLSIRNSLTMGIGVGLASTLVGAFFGLVAGFKGGWLDRLITLIMDSFIVIPILPILILFSSLTKGAVSLFLIGVILTAFNWPWPARQIRAMTLSIRESDFISTARFSGQGVLFTLFMEIFPLVLSWSFANFINTILVAIASESSLAIIGLASNEAATLGTMIYWATQNQAMLAGRWWWIGSPVISTALLFISLFLIMTGSQKYSAMIRGKHA